MTRTLLSLGHGYSARALARLLRPQGWRVLGTTRDQHHSETVSGEADEVQAWPGSDLSAWLEGCTHVLTSIAPTPDGDPVLNGLEADLVRAASRLQWVGYLSTTGVYGDHQGGWVNEGTPLSPATKRGQMRVDAERAWKDLANRIGLPVHIFRLAGIYGPGRGPFAKVRTGTARRIVKPNQVFSRIHVEDIAQVLAASIARPNPGAVYNVCDDDPAPPEDVIAHAAELLGLPVPPAEDFATAKMTQMARSFYAESKRVSNDRIKSELDVELKYPGYREGLAALLQDA